MRTVDDFGERLKQVRVRMKLDQIEVARVATERDELPNPTSFANQISRWENGRELNPSLEALEKLARGLGITLSNFFTRIETQSPEFAPQAVSDNDAALAVARDITDAQWKVLETVLDAHRNRLDRDSGTDHRQNPETEKSTSERLESGRTSPRHASRRTPARRPKPKGKDKH